MMSTRTLFGRANGGPSPLREALHTLTLWNFCVAQPLYDITGRNPAFFSAHRAQPADLVWTTLGLSVLLPAALVLVEVSVRLVSAGLYRALHFGVIAAVAARGSFAAFVEPELRSEQEPPVEVLRIEGPEDAPRLTKLTLF